jgi:hypothetical protein
MSPRPFLRDLGLQLRNPRSKINQFHGIVVEPRPKIVVNLASGTR